MKSLKNINKTTKVKKTIISVQILKERLNSNEFSFNNFSINSLLFATVIIEQDALGLFAQFEKVALDPLSAVSDYWFAIFIACFAAKERKEVTMNYKNKNNTDTTLAIDFQGFLQDVKDTLKEKSDGEKMSKTKIKSQIIQYALSTLGIDNSEFDTAVINNITNLELRAAILNVKGIVYYQLIGAMNATMILTNKQWSWLSELISGLTDGLNGKNKTFILSKLYNYLLFSSGKSSMKEIMINAENNKIPVKPKDLKALTIMNTERSKKEKTGTSVVIKIERFESIASYLK